MRDPPLQFQDRDIAGCYPYMSPHHMQDEVLIAWISIMVMLVPVCRVHVQFNIPSQGGFSHADKGQLKIRALVQVLFSRIEDFNGLAGNEAKVLLVKVTVFPDKLQQAFPHGYFSCIIVLMQCRKQVDTNGLKGEKLRNVPRVWQ
jgi:hypothetical protein